MPEPVIAAQGIGFTYPPLTPEIAATPLFEALELRVGAGEAYAVMGASGSGKSTLCYLLAGLAPRYTGGQSNGSLRIAGHDPFAAPLPAGAVGLLFQDAATQLFNATVEDEVAWGLETLGVPSGDIGPRVNMALRQFGLLPLTGRAPWTLSGGEQKRLALAAVWAMRPRVWALDEPLGGLDPVGRREVLTALAALRDDGATLLLTTLRPQTAQLADSASLLVSGTLTPPQPPAHLLAAEPRLEEAGILLPRTRWPKVPPSPHPAGNEPAIVTRNLSFTYGDGRAVLQGIDLAIPRGRCVALVGVNGAGKSTLARHFNGLLRPISGTVTILGHDAARTAPGELARQVGFLFQRPEQQIFGVTVRDEVAYGPRCLRLPDADARVERALARFDLSASATLPPAILSYGARRAVTLAALAALETPILVLDEPTVGLDGRGWAQLLDWLAERRAAGTTIILITHESELAAWCDEIIALRAGRILANRPAATVLGQLAGELLA